MYAHVPLFTSACTFFYASSVRSPWAYGLYRLNRGDIEDSPGGLPSISVDSIEKKLSSNGFRQ